VELQNELSTNKSGYMATRRPQLAHNMPNDFPNPEILNLYASPLTSRSDHATPVERPATMQLPNTEQLTRAVCRIFDGWDWGGVMNQFALRVWPGHFNRQMIDVGCYSIKNSDADPQMHTHRWIVLVNCTEIPAWIQLGRWNNSS
jgi:Holliday junction resolvase YEN1